MPDMSERAPRRGRIPDRRVGSETLPPSENLAWIIGILGGGYVRPHGDILLKSYDDNLLNAFGRVGSSLFGIESKKYPVKPIRLDAQGTAYSEVAFFSRAIAPFFGDLRRTEWPTTIRERHPWIIEESSYTWKFLEGFFEVRGNCNTDPSARSVSYNTSYKNVAETLVFMLHKLGIENARVNPNATKVEGIESVVISNLDEIKLFAQHIHSVQPEREAGLQFFRDYTRETITQEQIIAAYQMISDQKEGKPVSSYDFDVHSKAGSILFSRKAITTRLGPYPVARAKIDSILSQRRRAEQLYSEHGKPVLGFLYRWLHNPQDAQDALHEVFERAIKALPRFEERGIPKRAWLLTIARNYLTDKSKSLESRQKIEPITQEHDIFPATPESEEEYMPPDLIRDLTEALAKISEGPREVLALKIKGLEIPDIARQLGISDEYVRVLLHRGREKFKELWEKRIRND